MSSTKNTKKPYSLSSTKKLNNGHRIPLIHLGVYQTSGRECSNAVTAALEAGYRAIDSAEWYGNEAAVGSAIVKFLDAHPDVQRRDIWFVTKLKDNLNYDDTRMSIEKSIRKSGLGYIDLYLLHSPYGGKEVRAECWRAIEDAIEERQVRSGGVSNFGIKHVFKRATQLPDPPIPAGCESDRGPSLQYANRTRVVLPNKRRHGRGVRAACESDAHG